MKKAANTRHRHINTLSAKEIQAEFVADAVKSVPTPLVRFVKGMERAARLRGCSQEQVYQDVRQEVIALTGHGLPVA